MTFWRAFLTVAVPGYGLWLLARENPLDRPPGRPFSRRLDWFDLWSLTVTVCFLAAGLTVDSRFILFMGAFIGTAAGYRLALRLLSPAGWFRTDLEFRAGASVRSLTRVAFLSLLIWTVVTQRWTGAFILGSMLVVLVIVETAMTLALSKFLLNRKHRAHA
jgi:hypothetical protein